MRVLVLKMVPVLKNYTNRLHSVFAGKDQFNLGFKLILSIVRFLSDISADKIFDINSIK